MKFQLSLPHKSNLWLSMAFSFCTLAGCGSGTAPDSASIDENIARDQQRVAEDERVQRDKDAAEAKKVQTVGE
jgi:hypothetical protein